MSLSTTLKARLGQQPTLIVPDAFDPLSAQLIVQAGFEAVQCSGYSMSAANGYPKETNLSYSEALETTRRMVNAVRVPVMADGEDGFGNAEKLRQTVREFIAVGAAGINLEDQLLGAWDGKRAVVSQEVMVEKLKIAMETRATSVNPDFVFNARTDALAWAADRTEGLKEAIQRGNRYLATGADLIFVTGVRTLEEAKALKAGIRGKLSLAAGLPYNTRSLLLEDLAKLGLARISLPFALVSVSVAAMHSALVRIAKSGKMDDAVLTAMEDGTAVLKDLAAKS